MPLAQVLIADDDPGVRRLLELTMRGAGLAPVLASDGAAALEAVLKYAPSAIVLDWEMPVMDGRSFLRALRASGNRTPVVVVSAQRSPALGDERPDRIVAKPFDPIALADLVRELAAPPLRAAAAG